MSTGQLNLRTVKLGDSATPANNFLITTPAVADGSLSIQTESGVPVMAVDASQNVAMAKMPTIGGSPVTAYSGSASTLQWNKFADGSFIFSTNLTVVNPVINTYVSTDVAIPGSIVAIGSLVVVASPTTTNAAPTGMFFTCIQLNATTIRVTACANAVSTNVFSVIGFGRWK